MTLATRKGKVAGRGPAPARAGLAAQVRVTGAGLGWETPGAPDASSRGHETVVRAAVSDGGASARSVRGPRGRWGREASANPGATLPETEARVIARVSEDIRREYGGPRIRVPRP